MEKLSLQQMQSVEAGITAQCAGNAILVASSILSGAWLATAGLVTMAYGMGCLDEW